MNRHRFSRAAVLASASAAALVAAALVPNASASAAPRRSTITAQPVALAAPVTTNGAYRVATTTFVAGSGFGKPGSSSSTQLPSHLSAGQAPRTPEVDSSAATLLAPNVSHRASGPRGSQSGLPAASAASVGGPTTGLVSLAGNNAYEQGLTHNSGSLPGIDVEPPDQGVCAGPGYTMEVNNAVDQVFKAGVSQGTQALENLFGTPEIFGGLDGSVSVQGDPRCFYDRESNRWFASQIWFDFNNGAKTDTNTLAFSGAFVAVSATADPTGSWTSYFVPDLSNANQVDGCTNTPPATASGSDNPCLGDQPLLGVDANTVQISTNEYGLGSTGLPNGDANLYFLSKSALVAGSATVPENWAQIGGAVKAPESAGFNWSGWASLVPAQVPDGDYVQANGGTSYALSSLDFAGTGDNKIAEWEYTHTADVGSSAVDIYEQTLQSGPYAFAPNAVQKPGPIPLGDNWNALIGNGSAHLPEGALATNDDRMATAAYDPSTGALMGALNTGIDQSGYGHELAGIAYFTVTPQAAGSSGGLVASPVTSGYITVKSAYVQFPVIAVAPNGHGVIGYSLSGDGYYPSSAYSLIAPGDSVATDVHLARTGAGPQDGFSEYQGFGTSSYRPRWGDYSAAEVVGNSVTFATEMINQSCTDAQFQADFTCGGTRDLFANWGTSVDTLTP